MKSVFVFFLLIISFNTFGNCQWCVRDNPDLEKKINTLLTNDPANILKNIESEKISIYILTPERKHSKKYFTWGSVRSDTGKLNDLSNIEGGLGKTLCPKERPISKNGMTIVLSSDSPFSTLVHEYLHVYQINQDRSWCKISESLWGNKNPKIESIKMVRDREWDVRLFLWKMRNHVRFNVEDKIVIAEGLIKEAIFRSQYDSNSLKFIKDNKVEAFLNSQIELFVKNQPTVKVKATPEINIPYRKN